MPDPPVPKRTRARAPRVRTGCTTCKIRHLKCDEAKPSCRRCVDAGFICDADTPAPRAGTQKREATRTPGDLVTEKRLLAAQRRLLAPNPTPDPGSHELDRFQRCVAPRLSSPSDAGFWTVLVPQMATGEPAIRHAVGAICALNSDNESMDVSSSPSVRRPNPLAFKEAGKAMQSLSERIASEPGACLVPLVACLLFTCLELLCGDLETAVVHAANGFRILHGLGAGESGRESQRRLGLAERGVIEGEVAPVFRHLSVLCLLFGQTDVFGTVGLVARTHFAAFASLDGARRRLFELFGQILRFITAAGPKAAEGRVAVADIVDKHTLERALQQWHTRLEQFVHTAAQLGRRVDEHAVDAMRLHYHTIRVWLSACLSVDGAELDLHRSSFEEIVRLGERIAAGPATTASPPLPQNQAWNKLSFGMGVMPSLYWVARVCHDPTIRYRALNLLLQAPLSGSVWDACVYSKLVERGMTVEEAQKQHGQELASPIDCLRGNVMLASDRERGAGIPEHVRRYRIHSGCGSSMHADDQRRRGTFHARPWEPVGAWHLWDVLASR